MASPLAIAAAVAALLIAPVAWGEEATIPLPDRLSIEPTGPQPPPGITLLDPAWFLPPVESLETALSAAAAVPPGVPDLSASLPLAKATKEKPTGGPVSYSLSDHLSAQLRYRRSQGFDRSGSRSLRDDASTAFSTQPNRDVFDLNMNWDVAGSTLGVGYQLQSSAGGVWSSEAAPAGGISRFLPGNEQATHSLMFGLTRQWGAPEPPPVVVADPPLLPDLDVAVAEGTPTPAP